MLSDTARIPAGWLERILAAIFIVAGVMFILSGAFLLSLGGSSYYILSGPVLTFSGVQLWRGRVSGVWLFLLLFAGTIIWSLWEVGPNAWALLPRLGLFTALFFALLIVLWRARIAMLAVKFVTLGLGVAVAGLLLVTTLSAPPPGGEDFVTDREMTVEDGEWPHIGRTVGAERFSPLGQITPGNVAKLEVAWKVRLGMPPEGMVGALQATPLKIADTLYMCNMHNVILAIDAETGETRWEFDPEIDTKGLMMTVCRGVTYYKVPEAAGSCSERIVATTYDARLIALDARTGERCQDFGQNGEVSLLAGMGEVEKGYYYHTSPATLVRDKLVVGGAVLDGQKVNSPSGVIRGFDAVTGEFAWAWDMGRPDDHGLPPPEEAFTRGTPNAWPPMSGDDDLGLVYVPLGNPTPDYVSTHRTPVMDKYGSSVVAINVETGAVRWHYQTTHLDVWDYDNPAPAALVEFPMPDGSRPALIQPTKRGQFFVLDRRTGEPLVETVEKPVPQEPVAEERLSPTQPYPIGMPSFGGERLTEARMWGLTPFDQIWCRIKFRQARYDGDFTPISLKPTIVFPGYLGGSSWSGVSIDPEHKIMVLNVNYFPLYNQMIPRDGVDAAVYRPFKAGVHPMDIVHWAQQGAPYATKTTQFVSPLTVPCHQPPYSEIAAVDLTSRSVLWRKPLGTARDSGPFGIPSMLPLSMGVPALGGSLVTRSGLVFIAATQERTFRALDVKTGKLLWQDRLPAGGHASPMSYYSERSGRQFIVIPASGHPQMRNKSADYLIAYALPKQ